MPSLFKTNSIAELVRRREQVEREIASSMAFLVKIDRRIAHLKAKSPQIDVKAPVRALQDHP